MGDLADDAHDAWAVEQIDRVFLGLIDGDDPALLRWATYGKWVTRDGRKLALREMATAHLRHLVRFLQSPRAVLPQHSPRTAAIWIRRAQRELARRTLWQPPED